MKVVKIVLVVILITLLINWVRGEEHFDIRHALPLVNDKPVLYQWGGIALIGLLVWGLARLKRQPPARERELQAPEFHSRYPMPGPYDDEE